MGAEEAEKEGEEPVGGRNHVGTEVVEVERGGREYVSGAPAETTEGEREGRAKPKREAWCDTRDGEREDGPMAGEGSAKEKEEA
jgi:hypothetical protein